MKCFVLTTVFNCSMLCFGQIPSTPQPSTFQPVNASQTGYNPPNPYGQVTLGATAEDIKKQNNQNNPYYGYGNDPASIQRANEAWIKRKMANDPAYNPALRNGVNIRSAISKQQELHNLLQDIVIMDNNRARRSGKMYEDYNSPLFIEKTRSYLDALDRLKKMLLNSENLSIADAYFTMENAFGEAYLTKEEFNNLLHESTDFIKLWMQQHKLSTRNNADINYAVQQFMGETLLASKQTQQSDGTPLLETVQHLPFQYDFNDNGGNKDHRNFFVTKCLATGTGQCNSMPAIYLCLVERLGGKAFLAVAPQHSLIKYPDSKGVIRNYEPTSHWSITNEWYLDNLFVSKEAFKNEVYLSPWNKKQIVADIILQLSLGYYRKFGGADGKFITECINTATPYFPKNNNLMANFMKSNLYGYELVQSMRRNGINKISDIHLNQDAQKIYNKWQANENIIDSLGYQDLPKNMYQEMMNYHEFRGKQQHTDNFNGKEKRNLFIKTKATK